MALESHQLADLAAAVADGTPVDWDAVESGAMTPTERNVIAQLRALASVRAVARTPTFDTSSSITQSPNSTGAVGSAPAEVTRTGFPTTWRHLTLRELVGRGGFGVVYRAWDSRLDKEVALKLIPAGASVFLDAAIGEEARRLARVRHPNVVTIHGADGASGQFGLWMEFVRGRTLRQLIEERGPLGPQEALTFGVEVGRALAAVHAAGLVHRDVKAQNVMREDGGRVVLMDLGAGDDLASTAPRRMAGTPVYMAPELFEDRRATPQTDIYSLGVLLFYLVTGQYPVGGHGWDEVAAAHRSNRRRLLRDLRPDLPAAFIECVEALTAPDPSKRIQTAGAAEAALQRALLGEDVRRRRRRLATAALGMAAVAVAVAVSPLRTLFWGTPALTRIAVLPMVNLSGDTGRDYFVDGMTDQLIAELSRISAWTVTDRTSIMRYKRTGKSLSEIAAELGVDAILEASIVLSGSDLRLTAALIRASDGHRLWSNSYDRSMKDALVLQAELTRDLAGSIRVALTPEERRDLEHTFQAGPEAQDLYLRGRALQAGFNVQGCALLERAVTVEPKYALAWASLSRCYTLMENNRVLSPAEAAPKVREAATQAITHDPSLAEAHLALANARFRVDWDWRAARESFEQAIAVNRSFGPARDQYARFLAAAGRTNEAFDQARRAVDVDPQGADTRRTLALILFYQRRYADALARTDEATALSSASPGSYVVRGRTLAALGKHAEAIASIQQAMAMYDDGGTQLAELGRIYASAGRRDDALAILHRLPGNIATDGFVDTQDAGYILAALGRTDEAFARLERAVTDRSSRILYLRVDPRVDSLRNHPRFRALLARIGGLD